MAGPEIERFSRAWLGHRTPIGGQYAEPSLLDNPFSLPKSVGDRVAESPIPPRPAARPLEGGVEYRGGAVDIRRNCRHAPAFGRIAVRFRIADSRMLPIAGEGRGLRPPSDYGAGRQRGEGSSGAVGGLRYHSCLEVGTEEVQQSQAQREQEQCRVGVERPPVRRGFLAAGEILEFGFGGFQGQSFRSIELQAFGFRWAEHFVQ